MISSRLSLNVAIIAALLSYLFSLFADLSIEWEFSAIYDDRYNFLDFPAFNSLFPPPNSSLSLRQHLSEIVAHQGINVYEPIASLWKAGIIDLVGVSAKNIRVFSAFNHILNGVLLYSWLLLIYKNHIRFETIDEHAYSLLLGLVTIFLIHPLNMEVIGWLSAFSYVPALSLGLLSSICLESMIFCISHKLAVSQSRKAVLLEVVLYALLSALFFVAASLVRCLQLHLSLSDDSV